MTGSSKTSCRRQKRQVCPRETRIESLITCSVELHNRVLQLLQVIYCDQSPRNGGSDSGNGNGNGARRDFLSLLPSSSDTGSIIDLDGRMREMAPPRLTTSALRLTQSEEALIMEALRTPLQVRMRCVG